MLLNCGNKGKYYRAALYVLFRASVYEKLTILLWELDNIISSSANNAVFESVRVNDLVAGHKSSHKLNIGFLPISIDRSDAMSLFCIVF